MYKCGIYKITNLLNNKIYIGQSVHIEKRFLEHTWKDKNNHSALSNAFKKYGKDNFSFEVIEECNYKILNIRERYYIISYNSLTPNGYNIVLPPTEQKRGNTFVLGYDVVLNIIKDIKDSKLSFRQISKKYKVTPLTINYINWGKSNRFYNLTYPIRNTKEVIIKSKNYCIDCNNEVSKSGIRCVSCSHNLRYFKRPSKEVLENIMKENNYNKVAVGKLYGVSDTTIKKWCIYHDINYKLEKVAKVVDSSRKVKKIIQFDFRTNEIIKMHDSIREATRYLDVKGSSHIVSCCKGKRKQAYGYGWKYVI